MENPIIIKQPLWTKNYILILVSNFFTFMIHFALFTNLPTYVKSLGGNNTLAGMTTTIYTLSALAARPLFGYLTDKIGRRKVVVIGMAASMAAAIWFFFADTIAMVFAARVASGIGISALSTVIGTLVADNVPSERLSEGVGYSGISMTVSTAIGPAAGAYVIELFGFKGLFVFVFLITCISFFCSMLIEYRSFTGDGENESSNLFGMIFEKTSVKPSLIALILGVGNASVATFMTTFGAERALESTGVFFVIYAAVGLFARIGTGKIADRRGVNVVFWPGLIGLFCAYIALAFTFSMPMLVIAGIFYGIGYGISFPMINVIVMKTCPANRRGAAVAMLYAGMDIGIGVGAIIWGAVSQGAGFTAVYLVVAAVVMTNAFVYYKILHKQMKPSYQAE